MSLRTCNRSFYLTLTTQTASLNNQTILECDNMLVSHSVDVTAILNPGEDNVLSIAFAPALLRGRELKDKHSEYNHIACNGEPGRLAVRKAQYHWVRSVHQNTITSH